MAIRKTNQAADKGQGKGTKGKPSKAAKAPEATILDEDPEPEAEELPDSATDEDYNDPELDAPLPPAAALPPSKKTGAVSKSGKYRTLVTIRRGEDVHRAGKVIELTPSEAAEYLAMGAIRAA